MSRVVQKVRDKRRPAQSEHKPRDGHRVRQVERDAARDTRRSVRVDQEHRDPSTQATKRLSGYSMFVIYLWVVIETKRKVTI